jgi:Cu2+-exporting ATPase
MSTAAAPAVTDPPVARPAGGSPFDGAKACTCAHCGLPVPEGAARDGGDAFCCTGCEAVWHALHSCGLERYYELQRRAGEHGNRPSGTGGHAYLDHDEFRTRHVATLADGRSRVELRVDGMKCGACLWLLEALPRLERGLLSARVDLGRSVIVLEWAPDAVRLSQLARRIAALGYQVRPLGTLASREEWRRQDRRWLVDIGVAGALSGNVMAIAFGLYGAQLSWMDGPTRQFLQWCSVLLAAMAVAWPGRVYLRNAWTAIRTRTPHMDLPIALALLAGLLGGTAMTALGRPGVYLESVSMLVFLLLVGRFVQFRQQRRARHEIELLCALVPQTARRISADGAEEEVPTEALRPGDRVRVAAGEALPADGTLSGRESHLDLQLLTGEARPVRTAIGAQVFAGVRATAEPVELVVTAAGDATRAASIARMVEDAAGRRPPVVEFANRIAGWFLFAVLAVAAVTGVAWWRIDPDRAPSIVIALLVVTCPCALGLATPLTMVASLGKAARAGILVRGGDVLERLARPGTLVLDKTGTVTLGSMTVLRERGSEEAISLAAALERSSVHPVARAIAACRAGSGRVDGVREASGRGIAGTVDGRPLACGSRAFVRELGVDIPGDLVADADAMEADGMSPVFVAIDGAVVAALGIGDPVRQDARGLVDGFRCRGWEVRVASGDLPSLAQRAAALIGVEPGCAEGACTPERKMELVQSIPCRPVVMVGDGVNDLPAMAAADVGVAVRQGAQATVARADVALTGGGLAQLAALVDGARRTMRTVHVNFAISLAYNVLGGALAVTGTISPLVAAILMPLSGLTVTAVALRMPRFRAPAGSEGTP